MSRYRRAKLLSQASNGKIHLLYMEMCELLNTLMAQIVKLEMLTEATSSSVLLKVKFEDNNNHLPDKSITIGKRYGRIFKEGEKKRGSSLM